MQKRNFIYEMRYRIVHLLNFIRNGYKLRFSKKINKKNSEKFYLKLYKRTSTMILFKTKNKQRFASNAEPTMHLFWWAKIWKYKIGKLSGNVTRYFDKWICI